MQNDVTSAPTMTSIGSGDVNANSYGTYKTPSSPTDPTTVMLSCAEWTAKRILIEIFLIGVLFANIFSIFVIATTTQRRGSPFIIRCVRVINVSSLLLVLQLLFYPFVFSWSHLNEIHDDEDTHNHINSNYENQNEFMNEHILHPCHQAETATCRISGFMFGFLLFLPLLFVVLMTVDTALAAFHWKMYRFQPKTAAAIRIILLVSFTAALIMSFAFPIFGVGTHYHYHQLFKICWLSVHREDYGEEEFTYFIFGIGCFMVFLVCLFGFLVYQAYKADVPPSKQTIGYQCTILFGRFIVMKSQSWNSYVHFVMWMDLMAIIAYLPLTAGYIIIFGLYLPDTYWFNLVTEICVFFLPTVGPFIIIRLYKSHWERTKEILRFCCNKPIIYKGNSRVSPLISGSSTIGSSSVLFSDTSSSGGRVTDIPGPKLYSDSLKKQFQQEEQRRMLSRLTKFELMKQLLPISTMILSNQRAPESLSEQSPRSFHERYLNANPSFERPNPRINHPVSKRQSLPASRRTRHTGHSQTNKGYPRNQMHLNVQQREYRFPPPQNLKQPSPRSAVMQRSFGRVRDAANESDPYTRLSPHYNSGNYQYEKQSKLSPYRYPDSKPPSYQASPKQGTSAFGYVDEQGYMWSSDDLKYSDKPRKVDRKSKESGTRERSHSSSS